MVRWTTTKDENGRELSYGGDDRGRIRAAHRKVGGKLVLGIRVSRFESVTALREE